MAAAMESKSELLARGARVETYLGTCLEDVAMPEHLRQAMEYSLLAGGKRLRPVLCLAWAELFGAAEENILPFAAGIECIHTYSLIHDDLPAMDDDDLRRGKPSSHKRFGEALAILAGDGLLNEAFTLMLTSRVPAPCLVSAMQSMADASGARGMVGGQVLDLEYTGLQNIHLEQLRAMHAQKTGALIRSSCACGAILAGASLDDQMRASRYGAAIGLAFQVVDDILDVVGDEQDLGKPVGSDQELGKNTYPALLGLDASMELARQQVVKAQAELVLFTGPVKNFLSGLAGYIVERVN
ncbi:MAG: polyprenyl synthetase family protein [Desulfoplanes sp.]